MSATSSDPAIGYQPIPPGELQFDKCVLRNSAESIHLAHLRSSNRRLIVFVLRASQPGEAQLAEIMAAFHKLRVWKNDGSLVPIDIAVVQGVGICIIYHPPGGKLLQQLIAHHDPSLSPENALALLASLARCLDKGHQQGFVHSALAPLHVVVAADMKPGLFDFGLQALIRSLDTGRDAMLDRDSWPYWAPEIWIGRPAGGAVDQYALAAMAYQLLTGEKPDVPADFAGGRRQALAGDPGIRELLPPGAMAVLSRAFAFNASNRFDDCASFVEALAAELRRTPSAPEPAPIAADGPRMIVASFEDDPPPVAAPIVNAAAPTRVSKGPVAAPVENEAAKPERSGSLARIAAALGAAAVIAVPVLAHFYVSHKHASPKLVIRDNGNHGESPSPLVSDPELLKSLNELTSRIAELKQGGLDQLAPQLMQQLDDNLAKMKELKRNREVTEFITIRDESAKLVAQGQKICAEGGSFEKQMADAEAKFKADSPIAALAERWAPKEWDDALATFKEARDLAIKQDYEAAQKKLQEANTKGTAAEHLARVNAAAAPENSSSPEKQLEYLEPVIATGNAPPNAVQLFQQAAKTAPQWWNARIDKALEDCPKELQTMGYGLSAWAAHDLGDEDRYEKLMARAVDSAKKATDATRIGEYELILEICGHTRDAKTAGEITDSMTFANTGEHAFAMINAAGMASFFGEDRSWRTLGLNVLRAAPQATPWMYLELTFATGDYHGMKKMLESTNEPLLDKRGSLLCMVAMHGDKETVSEMRNAFENLTTENEADNQVIRAYVAVSDAFLGQFARAEELVRSLPLQLRTAPSGFLASAQARHGRIQPAMETLKSMPSNEPFPGLACREIAIRLSQANDDAAASHLYLWAYSRPAMQKAVALAWGSAALQKPEVGAVRLASAFARPKSITVWNGTLTPAETGGSEQKIRIHVLPVDDANAQALVEYPGLKLKSLARVKYTNLFAFVSETEQFRDDDSSRGSYRGRGSDSFMGGSEQSASGSQLILLPTESTIMGIRHDGSGERGRWSDSEGLGSGLVYLKPDRADNKASIAALPFFSWLLFREGDSEFLLPSMDPENTNDNYRVGVIGTVEQLTSVKAAVDKLREAFPKSFSISVQSSIVTVGAQEKRTGFREGGIAIHFAPRATHVPTWQRLYEDHGNPDGTADHFSICWSGRSRGNRTLLNAVAMIDPEAAGNNLDSVILYELARCLGLAPRGYYPYRYDSLFSDPALLKAGEKPPADFTDTDKRMLQFILERMDRSATPYQLVDQFLSGWE